jgi:hypothetical protein
MLENQTFERLGSTGLVKVNVRIIAAINKDLLEEVRPIPARPATRRTMVDGSGTGAVSDLNVSRSSVVGSLCPVINTRQISVPEYSVKYTGKAGLGPSP